MQISHLYGHPEVAVITSWHKTQVYGPAWKVHPSCELILATDNNTEPFRDKHDFMYECGFEKAPQQFVNPNTNNRVNFFACRAEDLKFPDYIPTLRKSEDTYMYAQSSTVSWLRFPAQCGLAVILQPIARSNHDISVIGRITIVPDDNPALMQQYLDAGYKLAYKLRTKSILYFHQAKEQLK